MSRKSVCVWHSLYKSRKDEMFRPMSDDIFIYKYATQGVLTYYGIRRNLEWNSAGPLIFLVKQTKRCICNSKQRKTSCGCWSSGRKRCHFEHRRVCGFVSPLNATFWLVLVQAKQEQQEPKDQMARPGQKVSSTKISCHVHVLINRTSELYHTMPRFCPACAIAAMGRPDPHARQDIIGSSDMVCTTSCCSVHPPVSEAYARDVCSAAFIVVLFRTMSSFAVLPLPLILIVFRFIWLINVKTWPMYVWEQGPHRYPSQTAKVSTHFGLNPCVKDICC